MYGASPWETIPDVLEMYGMCSYSNWFEYLEFVDPTAPERANQGLCKKEMVLEKGCVSPMASDATISRFVSPTLLSSFHEFFQSNLRFSRAGGGTCVVPTPKSP
jgi:hypothetical protein